MITFYPGPSKVYEDVEGYLQDAFKSGILQQNHRSKPFMQLLRDTIDLLKQKLTVPAGYHVCFVSSATEAWEVVSQSLVRKQSTHIFNGAFGKKWASYASNIHSVEKVNFGLNEETSLRTFGGDVVCLTHNETSNGTQLADSQIVKLIQQLSSDAIVAVDATSSMAGLALPWQLGDVWFASVQKCFGLPAGMGVMIYSDKALNRAEAIADRKFYNSLLFIHENFSQFQTHYTPNVLGIYLFNRVLQALEPIEIVDAKIKKRAADLYHFFGQFSDYQLLVQNEAVQSATVLAIQSSEEKVQSIKEKALQAGITLGNGYGEFKTNTFRIANFPAINNQEIEVLKRFFLQNSN
jgi:phosphoserine aminotransferase